jgi:hypothetical protein
VGGGSNGDWLEGEEVDFAGAGRLDVARDGCEEERFVAAGNCAWATAREEAVVLSCGDDVGDDVDDVVTVWGSRRTPRARKDARRSANICASAMLLNTRVAVCPLSRLDTVTALLERTAMLSTSRKISCFVIEVAGFVTLQVRSRGKR